MRHTGSSAGALASNISERTSGGGDGCYEAGSLHSIKNNLVSLLHHRYFFSIPALPAKPNLVSFVDLIDLI